MFLFKRIKVKYTHYSVCNRVSDVLLKCFNITDGSKQHRVPRHTPTPTDTESLYHKVGLAIVKSAAAV